MHNPGMKLRFDSLVSAVTSFAIVHFATLAVLLGCEAMPPARGHSPLFLVFFTILFASAISTAVVTVGFGVGLAPSAFASKPMRMPFLTGGVAALVSIWVGLHALPFTDQLPSMLKTAAGPFLIGLVISTALLLLGIFRPGPHSGG